MGRQNFGNLENDKAIALALQEEEFSGRDDLVAENLQASILAQDMLGPSKRHEHDNGWKMENGYDRQGNTDDHNTDEIAANDYGRSIGWELLRDILGLNEMVPVPVTHVPRTIEKIPSADEEISDHERLLERLRLYDMVERNVPGDGNCQFRSLSDQLYGSADHHGSVRDQIVQQLRSNPEMYEKYVPMVYADYLEKMSKNGEWGDHVTLKAAADKYGVRIFVITSFKDTCSIEILPHIQKSKRVIFLSFWAEVHYNSIYRKQDLPPPSAT